MKSSLQLITALFISAAGILSNTSQAAVSIKRLTAPLNPANGLPTVPDFGITVASSAKWMAFGSPSDLSSKGSVLLYTSAGAFSRKLVATDGVVDDELGTAVAISGDMIFAGAPGRDVSGATNSGAVYVFNAVSGKQIGVINYKHPTLPNEQRLGEVLAAEGDFLVAGCPNWNSGSGLAYIFKLATVAGVVSHSTVSVVTPSVENGGDKTGYAVAISGRLVLVGSPFWDKPGDSAANGGTVVVVDRDTGSTINQLDPYHFDSGSSFGYAISMEGTRAVISAPTFDTFRGDVHIYDLTSGVDHVTLALPSGMLDNGDRFGTSVVLRGSLALVSSAKADDSGSVFIFNSHTGEYRGEIPVNAVQPDDRVGIALASSSNGFLVGIPGASSDRAASLVVSGLASPLPGYVVASSGSEATGIPGATYSGFTSATIGGRNGSSNVIATVKPGVGTPAGTTKGLWSDITGGFSLLQRTGLIPGDPNKNMFSDIGVPQANLTDRLHYLLNIKGPNYKGPLQGTSLRIATAVPSGAGTIINGDIFGVGTVVSKFFGYSQSYDDVYKEAAILVGLSAGKGGVTAASDSGIEIHSGNTTLAVARVREGESIGLDKLGQINRISFNHGTAAFHASVAGSVGQGLYIYDARNDTKSFVARGTGVSPVAGATYSAILSEATTYGSNGHPAILWRATLKNTAAPAQNECLSKFINSTVIGVFLKGEVNTTAGIDPTTRMDKLLAYWSADNGATLLHCGLGGTGVNAANDGCLVYAPDSFVKKLLLREGDPAPGIGGAKIGTIQRVDFDAVDGNYAVLVSLVGAPKGMDQALYAGKTTFDPALGADILVPSLLLQKGTLVDGGFYGDSVVTGINLTTPGADKGGAGMRQPGAVGSGYEPEVITVLTFSDGTKKVVRLSYPPDHF